jgi:hypothetical protein
MYSDELVLFVSKFLEKEYPELAVLFEFLGEKNFGKFIKMFSGRTLRIPKFENIFMDVLSVMYLSFTLRNKNADLQLRKMFRESFDNPTLEKVRNNALKIKTKFSNNELNKIRHLILWQKV